ncbi:proline-serine-threonine phosphatase-interacting protein 1 isoform X2 [Pleuronectes platessa]|uniref:proline-serine-threonine phosphatase-interacting protein 1 isoform X2 n=1 Tax=Pleuronectes platessa TaxID=8262 RepID=UPI00232A4773|nr:proline-serine-threonine phosphatase-interacting protein 1 isoform X2 [Pleuronectes platessa]
MTPLMFKDAFWGSDLTCHAGYDAVIQRLRDGRQMCKDVEELLKMRALAEERYGKELVTIARKAGGHTEISTLRASFDQLRTQMETIGHFRMQLSDILKEEVKKVETFRERQKEQRKKVMENSCSLTTDSLFTESKFESIMDKVHKKKISFFKKTMESKRNYELRSKEADEAEQGAEKTAVTSKNSEKIRHRAKQCRQTANESEKLYFKNVMQLESVRQDWEETHQSTCEVFQQMEGDRIGMLRCALWDHCNHFSLQCVKDDEFYEEVRKLLEQCDITTDNNCFIETKGTRSQRPEPIVFERYFPTESPTHNNGQSLIARGGEDVMRRNSSHRGSFPNINMDSARSSLTSVVEISDGGYAPLTGLQQDTSLATFTADEESYYVLYAYTAQEEDELSVGRGDVVRVLERGGDGWWTVDRDGLTGLVPGNYLGKI